MKREKKTKWKREHYDPVTVGKDFGEQFAEAHIGTYASSTAFFFFLSFIPILLISLRITPLFGFDEEVIIRIVTRIAPEIAGDMLETVTREVMNVSGKVLPFSLILLAWVASQGTVALLYGLDKVYNVEEHRNFLLICLHSIAYTLSMLVVIGIMIYLIFGNEVSQYVNSLVPEVSVPGPAQTAWHSFLFLILGTVVFALAYTFIPDGKRNFLRQLPGALLSAVVWLIFSAIFRVYINGTNRFTSFYGSVAVVAILLFWLYCCFYILLLGGLVNAYYEQRIRSGLLAHIIKEEETKTIVEEEAKTAEETASEPEKTGKIKIKKK